MKKTIITLTVLTMLLSVAACGNGNSSTSPAESSTTTEGVDTTVAETEAVTEAATETEESITTEAPNSAEIETPDVEPEETVEHRSGGGIIGISSKKLADDGINIDLTKSVRNDATGDWRLTRMTADVEFTEYGLDYYRNYFESDDEVHVIVNFTKNTTTIVNYMFGMLDVTVHEYVENEEHDAKIIGNGGVLAEYYIYTDNGDIEKVQ